MNCPNCNCIIAINSRFCPSCGYQFNNKVQYINPNVSNYNQMNTNQNMNQNIQTPEFYNENPNTQNIIDDDTLIKEYIGKNADKIINSNFSICTFFLGSIYFAYRKLWLFCLILPLLNIFLYKSSTKFILGIIINIILAVFFKKIYLNHVYKQIKKIKAGNPSASELELIEICHKKGGTSLIVPIIVAVIGIVIPLVIVMFITSQSISGTINKASQKSLENSANIIADWYDREYAIYVVAKNNEELKMYSDTFKKTCVTTNCISPDGLTASYLDSEVLTAKNIDTTNIKLNNLESFPINESISNSNALSYVSINSTTGKSCVKLSTTNNKTVCSSSCTKEQCTK